MFIHKFEKKLHFYDSLDGNLCTQILVINYSSKLKFPCLTNPYQP